MVQCPDCGTMMDEQARFCPGCGRPRTFVEAHLRRLADASGEPYDALLERARMGVIELPSQPATLEAGWTAPHGSGARRTPFDAVTVVAIAVVLALAAIGGGEAFALVGLAVLAVVAYMLARARIAASERRVAQLEARLWVLENAASQPAVAPRAAPAPAREDVLRPQVRPEPQPVEPSPGAMPPEPAWQPAPPSVPRRRWSTADLEDFFSGRVLALVGGLAIVVGAVFFLSLAFSRGWIGPSGRVLIGVAASALMLAAGAWFFERRERVFGHVLLAVGLSVMSLSLFAATNFYDLIPVALGLAGAMASAAVAAVVAIRARSQVVAGYGLVTVLAAPPVLGASPTLSTVGFVAVALAATAAIALFRSWRWLPMGAFLLTAPQFADWLLGDAGTAWGLVALAGFWVVNAVAAGGEEFRARTNTLSPTSATLLMANALFAVWGGFVVLDGDHDGWRGLFLLALGVAHLALAAGFLRREGERHPFGLLSAGAGVAALSVAVPVQLGGPVVPMIWAAQAAALAWVYARRDHRFSGGAALALGVASALHLGAFEYPFPDLEAGVATARPFLNASGGTLGFILAAMTVSGVFVRRREVRALLAGAALLLLAYALPFEVEGVALVAGWAALFVAGVALHQQWQRIPASITGDRGSDAPEVRLAVLLPGLLAGLAATLRAIAVEMPLDDIARWPRPDIPFTSEQTATAAVLIGAGLLVALASSTAVNRRIAVCAALLVAGYLMPFELGRAAMVVAWAALATGAVALERRARRSDASLRLTPYVLVAAALGAIGLLVALVAVAPPNRLFVRAGAVVDHPLLWSGATAALLALAVASGLAAWLLREWLSPRWLATLCGALVVYLLSVGVVDSFQARVGTAGLESLQKQAQVALSILWATLGVGALIAGLFGLLRSGAAVRIGGLALLGLSTAKVFIYDLSSLDASYRVLSFIGLGILLLASSYAYQRMMPNRSGRGG